MPGHGVQFFKKGNRFIKYSVSSSRFGSTAVQPVQLTFKKKKDLFLNYEYCMCEWRQRWHICVRENAGVRRPEDNITSFEARVSGSKPMDLGTDSHT